jgi:protein involved in polysaccharide export with SLBB domain
MALGLVQAAGCSSQRPWVDRAIMAEPTPPATLYNTRAEYLVSCPDVLEIKVSGRPELTGTQEVGGDGKIIAPNGERVRVEGLSTPDAARRLAGVSSLNLDQVTVKIAEYRSQQVYLFGQGVGEQRSVPYQGPETVVDLLKRVGGVTPGAAPDEVYVVRARIAEGKQPEVFHIKLRDILTRHDDSTNIRLQPQDRLYVGETNRSALSRYMPPWLKPLFDAVWGMARPTKPSGNAT